MQPSAALIEKHARKPPVCFVAALLAACLLVGVTIAAEPSIPVTVHMEDGRVLTGELREQSDEFIWLETTTSDATVTSRFHQRSISRIIEGSPNPLPSVPSAAVDDATEESIQAHGYKRQRELPSVQSLQIEATLANWDEDASADGLLVTILPLAADGSIVPVTGTVDLALFAQVNVTNRSPAALKPGLRQLEQSSHRVWNDDFSAKGAIYQLPFDRSHPDVHAEIDTHGIVHVRLSVSGSGVFEAADTYVRVRRFSPTSDRFQLPRPGRFVVGDPRNGR